ncbi:MAG: HhH-GPD-type base excision DNA repair protein [Acidimicrobiales bacterium]
MRGTLAVTGDPAADRLLNRDPLALMIGMLLDQQISIELAFVGPARLRERLGGELDAKVIARIDPESFAEICRAKPALHRFPASMSGRIQAMCAHLVDRYDGDAGAIWRHVRRAETLRDRLLEVPGFGPEKTQIFIALLAKRFGRRPLGWEHEAGVFAEDGLRSVADLDSPDALVALREVRRAMKAAGKSKTD